ncbi:hypothetical protein GCM10028781_21630 [Nostocoides australiense]
MVVRALPSVADAVAPVATINAAVPAAINPTVIGRVGMVRNVIGDSPFALSHTRRTDEGRLARGRHIVTNQG